MKCIIRYALTNSDDEHQLDYANRATSRLAIVQAVAGIAASHGPDMQTLSIALIHDGWQNGVPVRIEWQRPNSGRGLSGAALGDLILHVLAVYDWLMQISLASARLASLRETYQVCYIIDQCD